jgi:uncharacterized protein with ACT and thioredoxin-like domain
MRKSFYLLMMMMACMPFISFAQVDDKYLAGTVPEEDGKIVFKKEYVLRGADRDVIYEQVYDWLEKRMKANENNGEIKYHNFTETNYGRR